MALWPHANGRQQHAKCCPHRSPQEAITRHYAGLFRVTLRDAQGQPSRSVAGRANDFRRDWRPI